MKDLGIDPATLNTGANAGAERKPSAQPETHQRNGAEQPLTIAEAKKGLAQTFGVSPDAIEITIRG